MGWEQPPARKLSAHQERCPPKWRWEPASSSHRRSSISHSVDGKLLNKAAAPASFLPADYNSSGASTPSTRSPVKSQLLETWIPLEIIICAWRYVPRHPLTLQHLPLMTHHYISHTGTTCIGHHNKRHVAIASRFTTGRTFLLHQELGDRLSHVEDKMGKST